MAALDAWLVFEDEAGFSMTPPTTRTWSRRGHTPVIRVQDRRLPVAAPACYKCGELSRLDYCPCPDAWPDGRKSFSWKDYRDLIQSARQQLGGPIVLVWDNCEIHGAPSGAGWRARTTVRKAWASTARVTQRDHDVKRRT